MVNFSGSQRPKTDLPVPSKNSKPEIGRLNKLRAQASSIGSKTSREVAGKFKDGRQLLMDRALPQAKSLISNLHKLQTRYFPIFLVVLKSRSDAVRARLQKVARRLMASGLSDWARKGTNGEVGKKERAGNLAVLTVEEFLADWEAEAKEAKVRVLGQSMNFEPYRSGEIVTRIFSEATSKGVRKELLLDWNARLEDDETSTALAWLNPWIKERIQWSGKRKEEMWRQMRAAGTEIRFTNPPKNILEKAWPVTGRNHLKAAAVDERAFYIGGFNFGNLERDLADFMVKFTDPKVVAEMTKWWERINGRIVVEDEVVEINEELTLLIDGGKAGRSIILDRVASEVGAAKAFVLAITSNLYPDGKLVKAFDEVSRRGVKTEVICGRHTKVRHKWPIGAYHLFWLVEKLNEISFRLHRYKVPILANEKVGVHAKLVIIDGKVAIFGTHNMSEKGVRAGTKEWMAVVRNKELISSLMKFYEGLRGEVVQTP